MMMDEYANTHGYHAAPSSDKKGSWQDRARAGVDKTVRMIAEHGTTIGLAGGATLMALGVGHGAISAFGAPAEAVEYQETMRTLMSAGLLKLACFSGAEVAARIHLDDIDDLFDDESYRAAAYGTDGQSIYTDPRSSAPIKTMSDDAVLADPRFQEAIKSIFCDLQHDPEARHEIYAMLQSNPNAREALMNAQHQVDQNPNNKQSNTAFDQIDDSDYDAPS